MTKRLQVRRLALLALLLASPAALHAQRRMCFGPSIIINPETIGPLKVGSLPVRALKLECGGGYDSSFTPPGQSVTHPAVAFPTRFGVILGVQTRDLPRPADSLGVDYWVLPAVKDVSFLSNRALNMTWGAFAKNFGENRVRAFNEGTVGLFCKYPGILFWLDGPDAAKAKMTRVEVFTGVPPIRAECGE
jgi:hypothetical protein